MIYRKSVFEILLIAAIYFARWQSLGGVVGQVIAPSSTGCQAGIATPVADAFPLTSSLLHIFEWMVAPCSGVVQAVTFVNTFEGRNKYFHLALFDPIANRVGAFRLVNFMRVDINGSMRGWQSIQLPLLSAGKPFRAEKGNVFGFFYDFYDVAENVHVIPYRTNMPNPDAYSTYIGFMGLADVRQVRELRSGVELAAKPVSRIPALLAKISSASDAYISCGPLPDVPHGTVVVASATGLFFSGDFIMYSCQEGFLLAGSMYVSCQPTGSFTPLPLCLGSCGVRSPAVENAVATSKSYSVSSRVGDMVIYECSPGYVFANGSPDRVVCLLTLTWSERPQCIAIATTTPVPTTVTSAESVGTTVVGLSSLATAAKIAGPVSICQGEPTVAFAKVADRTFPADLESEEGDAITFACNAGYEMVGKNTITCLGGKWTAAPTCSPNTEILGKTCGTAPKIVNGYIYQQTFEGNKSVPGDSVTYACNNGFALNGSAIALCTSIQTWTAAPGCSQSCGIAPQVSSAVIAFKSFEVFSVAGSMVRYTCNQGAILRTNYSGIICGEAGRWNLDPPVCDDKSGGGSAITPTPSTNDMSTPKPESSGKMTIPVKMIMRTRPEGGWSRTTTWAQLISDISSAATAAAGASSSSSATATTSPISTTLFSCGPPLKLDNGDIADDDANGPSTTVGSLVHYKCRSGYVFSNKDTNANLVTKRLASMCMPTGWTNPPSCVKLSEEANKMKCGKPPAVENGEIVDVPAENMIQYTCRRGFRLDSQVSSNGTVQCLSSGSWSSVIPKCVAIVCNSLPSVANADLYVGSFESLPIQINKTLQFVCRKGYRFVELNSTTCLDDGSWSQLPICLADGATLPPTTTTQKTSPMTTRRTTTQRKADCGATPIISNGQVTRVSNPIPQVGDWAEYTCSDTFQITGLRRIICTFDGTWSEAPKCVPAASYGVCGKVPTVDHGYIVEKTFTNASVEGSRVVYACDFGYTVDGDTEVKCLNRRWTVTPDCIKDEDVKTCGQSPKVANGIVVSADFEQSASDSTRPGNRATYRCKSYFALSTGLKAYSTCLKSGTWSQQPTCVDNITVTNSLISCGPAPKVPNAAIVHESYEHIDADLPSVGSVVIYECLNGYRFNVKSCGSRINNYIQCAIDGYWTEAPECVPIATCGSTPAVENARISQKTFVGLNAYPGHKVYYSCLSGYELQSSASYAECSADGSWSALPVCSHQAAYCESPPLIPYSRTIYSNFVGPVPVAGNIVIFGCTPGYLLIGDPTIQCGDDGQWSPAPSCQPYSGTCSSAPSVANAVVYKQSYANGANPVPGDFIRVRCNSGFLITSDSDQITCTVSGVWSDPPSCISREGSCGEIPLVTNANVTYKTFKGNASSVGDIVWYECAPTFEAVGSTAIRCQSSKEWTLPPYCRFQLADSCGPPPQVPNGFFTVPFHGPSRIGTKVAYDCSPPYTISGINRQITCQSNGRWTTTPACKNSANRNTCGPVPIDSISNAFVVEQNFDGNKSAIGSYAAISCGTYYILRGPARIECLEGGAWSELPHCVIRSSISKLCGPAPNVTNGVVVYSSVPEFSQGVVGDAVWYKCSRPFQMRGFPGVTCNNDGIWSVRPQCVQNVARACPTGLNLIFVADLAESENFTKTDAENVGVFFKDFAKNWPTFNKDASLSGDVALSVGVVTLAGGAIGRHSVGTAVNISSNPAKRNDSLAKWASWIDVNFDTFSFVLNDDLARLFEATRTRIAVAMPDTNPFRIVYLTANRRESSVVETRGELASLRAMWARVFSLALGSSVASTTYQTTLRQQISTNSTFFRFFQAPQQLRADVLAADTNFLDFLCS